MSRMPIPLVVTDSSSFARTLRGQLVKLERQPTHLELLNMLARAGGHRNFQHLRAAALSAAEREPGDRRPTLDVRKVEQVLRHFDEAGRMIRWPSRTNHQQLCLWGVWAHIPARQRFSEAQVNGFIAEAHTFGDYAILRRSLVNAEMLVRTPDGRIYRRVEKQPVPEEEAVLNEIRRRAGP